MIVDKGMLIEIEECDFEQRHLMIPCELVDVSEKTWERLLVLCSQMESISVENGNPVFHASGNCLIHTPSNELVATCPYSVIPTDGSVEIIGMLSLSGFKGRSLTLPDSVVEIKYMAFLDAYSEEREIPSSKAMIGNRTIGGWHRPTELYVHPLNPYYYSESNCIIETDTQRLVACTAGTVIPEGVKSLGALSLLIPFENDEDMAVVTFPSSVESIETDAAGLQPWLEFPIVFRAPKDSYVADFAREHELALEEL